MSVEQGCARDDGHRFTDGAPPALCRDCSAVYDRRRGLSNYISDWEDDRAVIAEAAAMMSAVPMGMVAPAGLVAFAETERADKIGGKPWSHLKQTALTTLRLDLWASCPTWAPPGHEAEIAAHRAAEQARHDAAAAKAAIKASARDRYGF